MKRPRHKRIILYGVAEYHYFRGAEAMIVFGGSGAFKYNLSHQPYRVHIDSRAGRAYVYRGTNVGSFSQGFRYRFYKFSVSRRKSLVNKGGIATYIIYAGTLGNLLEYLCKLYGIALCRSRKHCYRGNRKTLVYNGYAIAFFYLLARSDMIFRHTHHFLVYFVTSSVYIAVNTIQKRYSHCYSAYVEILLLNHLYCFEYIVCADHFRCLLKYK